MSRLIQQPINQVKLTNVAVVKLQLQGKRFEIACYRNKIMDYRSGHETDISEVLQADRVFTNVSKGQFAKTQDLRQVFDTTDQQVIVKIILNHPKSIVQVSDKERELQQADSLARISTWMANHCVHSVTQQPYTVLQIQSALSSSGYNVQPHKALKKQYLDALKYLKQQNVLDIERAKMELLLTCTHEEQDSVMATLKEMEPPVIILMVERQEPTTNAATTSDALFVIRIQVDPSLYRNLDQLVQSIKGGKLEIVHQQVVTDVNANIAQQGNRSGERGINNDLRAKTLAGTANVNESDKLKQQRDKHSESSSGSSSSDSELDITEQRMAGVSLRNNDNTDNASDDSESDKEETVVPMSRKQLRQQQKKHSKMSKRQQEAADEEDADSSDKIAPEATTSRSSNALASTAMATYTDPDAKSCNTCGGSFPSAAAYRTHFKSDWHRFNQKLKLQGLPPVSEQEFDLVDADAFFAENLS
ncbi:hypothetical protein MPSEU_000280100 [Mayamaea pseudoterrestris]|nr:hypothetical protein MPSEU_000280100 [Mayamaea pseudoterrestris]